MHSFSGFAPFSNSIWRSPQGPHWSRLESWAVLGSDRFSWWLARGYRIRIPTREAAHYTFPTVDIRTTKYRFSCRTLTVLLFRATSKESTLLFRVSVQNLGWLESLKFTLSTRNLGFLGGCQVILKCCCL